MSSSSQKRGERLTGEIGQKYKQLVQILTSDPRYAKAMADVTAPSQHDKLADSLTALSLEVGTSLNIIKALIELEFQRKNSHPFTILRVNSIVSKMMGKYVKGVGTGYLNELFGDLIRGLYEKPDVDLEVDKSKMSGVENVDELVQRNMVELQKLLQSFLDRIISSDLLTRVPRQIRAICYFMRKNGELYNLNFETIIVPLLSGFMMLRYICPAITLPNNWEICQKMPEGNVRKNLTMVAKVLQKLANGELYDSENHLLPLNKFFEANNTKFITYLKQLSDDPLQTDEDQEPFSDLLEGPISFEDIHQKSFDMKDLLFIHRMIYEYGFELIVSLQNDFMVPTDNKQPISASFTGTEALFLSLVQQLGPPPDTEHKRKMDEIHSGTVKRKDISEMNKLRKGTVLGPRHEMGVPLPKRTTKKRENLKGKKFSEIESTIIEKSIEFLMKKVDLFDLSDLEASRFLYTGKPTRDGTPTFYLVLHRVKPEFLDHGDRLMTYIYKTIGQHLERPYVLIIDLTWADLNDEVQASLYRAVVGFTTLISSKHLTNCEQILIIQPTEYTLSAMIELLYLMDDEARNEKVRMLYDWTDLAHYIEPNNIFLPFISKTFIPITYKVMKLVDKEKKQERLMKLTNESILIISPNTGTVKSEIMLQRVKEVQLIKGTCDFIIRFEPESERERTFRGAVYLPKNKATDTQVRKYSCLTEQQRDKVVQVIHIAAVHSSSLNGKQTFQVLKGGKKRLIKFTLDSILKFKDNVIQREIPYSTLQRFDVDPSKKNMLSIDFWLNGQKKQYVLDCGEKAEEIRDSLAESHARFHFNVEVEKEVFIKTSLSSAIDKFFSNVVTNYNKETTIRIDKVLDDLKRLHKQISTGADFPDRTEIVAEIDKDHKGSINYEDLVRSWITTFKTKNMLAKRKAL